MPQLIRVLTYADLGELVFREEWGLRPIFDDSSQPSEPPGPPAENTCDAEEPSPEPARLTENRARSIADLAWRMRSAHTLPRRRAG